MASITSCSTEMVKWVALVPFTPPNCSFDRMFSPRSLWRMKLSRTLEKNGVHERFQSSPIDDGIGTFGIRVTDSSFLVSGHWRVSVIRFKNML